MRQNTSATTTIAILRELLAKYQLYNGAQFRSEEFAHFMKVNGVICVAPYNVASNGLGERMARSFKNQMKACKGSKL